MNFSYHTDEGIVITESRALSDEALHSEKINHEGEELSLNAFEGQGVSIIKPTIHPCIEVHDQASQDIMTRSGVEIIACNLEDIEI